MSAADAPQAAAAAAAAAPAEDKFQLSNAIMGEVVTRFPPEASGFLHIGHAKAALTNSILRTKFAGKMVFRFDDTNPEKEKEEFEHIIQEDLATLGVTWDVGPTYSSDYFDLMLKYADQMLNKGEAYVDFTPKEEMRECRFNGIATKCRVHSVEENVRLWGEMIAATELGQTCCLRAKMSIDDNNKCLRDPVMYRVNLTPHARTAEKYKVYPTYDFCCPIVDSVEGVTHALRTNEYHDRNDQYYWFCDTLALRKPTVEDFSRLNMEYTLMSKRKLTQLVDTKVVEGWNDPRFPTVRGLLRRGLKVPALKAFVEVQGMSKAVNVMEWSKLWNFNNQEIDAVAPRYTVVSNDTPCKATISGGVKPMEQLTKLRHKKNAALGEKQYYQNDVVLLDGEDVALLKVGDEVTLMDWGNVIVKAINVNATTGLPDSCDMDLHLEGEVKKTKYKLTWIAENPKSTPFKLVEFDHLLTKKKLEKEEDIDSIIAKVSHYEMNCLGEEALAEVKVGDTVQLERRGFFRVDADKPLTLFAIPDGRDKLNHLSAKAQWVKATGAAKGGKKADEGLTLEEKRAAKKAAKAAKSGPKKEDK
jgi:glutamyl-tRNA synthetase